MAFVIALPPDVSWRIRAAMFGQSAGIGMAVISACGVQLRLDRKQKARALAKVFATEAGIALAKTKHVRLYVLGAASRFEELMPLIALGAAVLIMASNVIVLMAN